MQVQGAMQVAQDGHVASYTTWWRERSRKRRRGEPSERQRGAAAAGIAAATAMSSTTPSCARDGARDAGLEHGAGGCEMAARPRVPGLLGRCA